MAFVLAGVAIASSLSGCRGGLDELRMRVDEDEQGSLTAQVSANISEEERDDSIENSQTYAQLNGIGNQLTARCNIRHLTYPRDNIVYLDLRADFADIDDLNSLMRCAAVNFDQPSAEFERHDGFLWNTFVVRFTINRGRYQCPTQGDCPAPVSFPRVILLTVPGTIHRIGNHSRLVGIDLSYRAVDDDTLRVETGPAADYRAQNLRHFGGRRASPQHDKISLEIVSRVANFNLSTILSVIGMIFGSGLLIQGSRWFFSRAKEKAAAKEGQASTESSATPRGRG